jgi:hypothetical protein
MFLSFHFRYVLNSFPSHDQRMASSVPGLALHAQNLHSQSFLSNQQSTLRFTVGSNSPLLCCVRSLKSWQEKGFLNFGLMNCNHGFLTLSVVFIKDFYLMLNFKLVMCLGISSKFALSRLIRRFPLSDKRFDFQFIGNASAW